MNGVIDINITSSDNPSVFGEVVTLTAVIVAPNPYLNVPVTGKVRDRLWLLVQHGWMAG